MKKILLLTAALVLILGMVFSALLNRTPAELDLESAGTEEILEQLTSPKFPDFPEDYKKALVEKHRELRRNQRELPEGERPESPEITDQQREVMRENMREVYGKMMRERLEEFFTLPEEEQTAFLDRILDEQDNWRRRRNESATRAPPSGERTERRRETESGSGNENRNQNRLKERIESASPEERAKFLEFMKALRQRREERGEGR